MSGGEYFFTIDWMQFHQVEFFAGELARFVQNLERYANLAQIMQQAAQEVQQAIDSQNNAQEQLRDSDGASAKQS